MLGTLTPFDDYVSLCNYIFKTLQLTTTNDWVGHMAHLAHSAKLALGYLVLDWSHTKSTIQLEQSFN